MFVFACLSRHYCNNNNNNIFFSNSTLNIEHSMNMEQVVQSSTKTVHITITQNTTAGNKKKSGSRRGITLREKIYF